MTYIFLSTIDYTSVYCFREYNEHIIVINDSNMLVNSVIQNTSLCV